MDATAPLPLAVLLAANILSATAAQANDSAYTDLNLDNCQTIEADAMGASLLCKGFNGLGVHFKEGDLRQSVLFGPVDRELQHGAFESFSAFNRVNDKIEWRRDASGKPFATILRWFIENPGPGGSPSPESTGQVLVISRVATRHRTIRVRALSAWSMRRPMPMRTSWPVRWPTRLRPGSIAGCRHRLGTASVANSPATGRSVGPKDMWWNRRVRSVSSR
ncbi:MAG: hypothetical protein ACK43M_07015 [Allorhizobium sp.]